MYNGCISVREESSVTGTFINVGTVLAGSLIGLACGRRLPERLTGPLMQAVAMFTLVVGLKMALGAGQPILVLLCLVSGAVAGELLRLEDRLEAVGRALEARLDAGGAPGRFTRGFVSASLLFCVGPMAILGAFRDGLAGDNSVLVTKAAMDGVASVAMAAGLGFGVACSAVPVLVYQGALTLLSGVAAPLFTAPVVNEMTALGGTMVLAIGLNMLGVVRLKVANLSPGLVFIAIAAALI